MKIFLPCLVVIVAMMVTEANAAGNGCTWSGCQHLTGAVCSTGVTGASGRPIRKDHKKCETFGRKDFCCDEDCRHQECGWTCGNLNMKAYGEVAPIPCSLQVPMPGGRIITVPTSQYFCCP